MSSGPPAAPPPPKKKRAKKPPADPAEVDKWLAALEGESEDAAFAAAIELARLGDMRAVDPLMRQLAENKDFYVRLAAATALGQMRATRSVDALIDALGEKDALVRTAAAEALRVITQHKFKFAPQMKEEARTALQEELRNWWRDNEVKVVERLRAETK